MLRLSLRPKPEAPHTLTHTITPTPHLVGNTGLEPVTSALSKQRSKPPELITRA